MKRTKSVARKGKGASSSRGNEREEVDSEILREMEEEEEMRQAMEESRTFSGRAPRRSQEQMAQDAQTKWEGTFVKRRAKNERHVNTSGFLEDDPVIARIRQLNLNRWLEPNPGYNLELVREFYKNIKVPPVDATLDSNAVVTSSVGRIKIRIDANLIAQYLGYTRPDPQLITFPDLSEPLPSRTCNELLYGIPVPKFGAEHKPGLFRPKFRFLNQLVHFNLYPRGPENHPNRRGAELMVAFNDQEEVCDWALYILGEIIDFRHAPTNTRMPFPCMITFLCRARGVRDALYASNAILEPGDITVTNITQSVAQAPPIHPSTSQPSTSAQQAGPSRPSGTYLTTPPPKGTKVSKMIKKLLCQGTAIMNSLRKIKKEGRQTKRNQERMEHRMDWIARKYEGVETGPYVPPTIPEPEDSDDFAMEEPDGSD